jgi:hypothetical protein
MTLAAKSFRVRLTLRKAFYCWKLAVVDTELIMIALIKIAEGSMKWIQAESWLKAAVRMREMIAISIRMRNIRFRNASMKNANHDFLGGSGRTLRPHFRCLAV